MANEYVETRGYKIGIEKNADDTTYSPMGAHGVTEWILTTSANNSAAIVAKFAVSGKNHFITGISGSFSVAKIKLMTLKDGATVIGNFYVHNQRDIIFDKPIKISTGAAVELSLDASGTAGEIGAVVMTGYTKAT